MGERIRDTEADDLIAGHCVSACFEVNFLWVRFLDFRGVPRGEMGHVGVVEWGEVAGEGGGLPTA